MRVNICLIIDKIGYHTSGVAHRKQQAEQLQGNLSTGLSDFLGGEQLHAHGFPVLNVGQPQRKVSIIQWKH